MNFDIFIRVIDWFVSICETTWQEAMINGREKGGEETILIGSLPITILDDTQKFWTVLKSEQMIDKYLTCIKVQKVVIDRNCI